MDNQWNYINITGELPKRVPHTFAACVDDKEGMMYFALGYNDEGTTVWELEMSTFQEV